MSKVIDIKFSEDESIYGYKHFDAILSNKKIERYYYHKTIPLPSKEEMIGLSFEKLNELLRERWFKLIERKD